MLFGTAGIVDRRSSESRWLGVGLVCTRPSKREAPTSLPQTVELHYFSLLAIIDFFKEKNPNLPKGVCWQYIVSCQAAGSFCYFKKVSIRALLKAAAERNLQKEAFLFFERERERHSY